MNIHLKVQLNINTTNTPLIKTRSYAVAFETEYHTSTNYDNVMQIQDFVKLNKNVYDNKWAIVELLADSSFFHNRGHGDQTVSGVLLHAFPGVVSPSTDKKMLVSCTTYYVYVVTFQDKEGIHKPIKVIKQVYHRHS